MELIVDCMLLFLLLSAVNSCWWCWVVVYLWFIGSNIARVVVVVWIYFWC